MTWAWALLPAVAVYVAALRCTARPVLIAVALALLGGVGMAVVYGVTARAAVGGGLVAAGAVALVWSAGRWRRRRRAIRSAAIPRQAVLKLAADTARNRLAAELHDVAAHRLTSIVVSTGAAVHLADPTMAAQAAQQALTAGRIAVAELDRLTTAGPLPDTLAEVDFLVSEFPGVDYRREVGTAPAEVVATVYRVVREALTNATRYASGARIQVRIDGNHDEVTVAVVDGGGCRAEVDGGSTVVDGGGCPVELGGGSGGGSGSSVGLRLGSGWGLAGLRAAVAAVGGTFTAGPEGSGWAVRACLPVSGPSPPRDRGVPLDGVAPALAVATSIGFSLMSDEAPDSFASIVPAASLLLVLGLHAVSLVSRRRAPGRSLALALVAFLLWLGFDSLEWTWAPANDAFLVLWWVELVLVYTAGVARAGWHAPAAVAVIGGAVLASGRGIVGDRVGAAGVLAVMVAGPTFAVWAIGLWVGAVRRRRQAAAACSRAALDRSTADAARAEHQRVSAGLHRSARRHAEAVVQAADAGKLALARVRARAGLVALRRLLMDLRDDPASDDIPPTLAGIPVLARRRQAAHRQIGEPRAVSSVVEVSAYQAAETLVTDGSVITVAHLGSGIELAVSAPTRPDRRLRGMVDAIGGRVTDDRDGTIRVWLPDPAR
ncbi:sensor histidine kinase [Actinocrispum wychmicini]|uniref:histidine kinase n=1 Tax=Actinocrispum wychmicini TaxID=1213861 RepID=A0A4R2J5K8_9PSEU|nr:histidine kinase [Actinocrispum wychmicini]TCO54181.1 signal transduction histidine kinase [Actinocrispum wychmicini]